MYVVFGDKVEVCLFWDLIVLKMIKSESILNMDLVDGVDFFVGGVCR